MWLRQEWCSHHGKVFCKELSKTRFWALQADLPGPPLPTDPPGTPPVTPSRNETIHMRNGRGAAKIQAADPWGPPRYPPVTPSIPSACVTPARSKRDPPSAKRTIGGRHTAKEGGPRTPGDPPCAPCLRDPGPVELRPPACEMDKGRPRYGRARAWELVDRPL